MLVVTLKAGESVQIGEVTIHNLRLKRDKSKKQREIQIGIEAPPDIKIVRTKLLERAESEQGK